MAQYQKYVRGDDVEQLLEFRRREALRASIHPVIVNQKFVKTFTVTVESRTPIADLCDHVANRLWSLDKVESVTATEVTA